ncbi:MAG: hypothetical protein ACM30I_16570 [Gemmatimonas sp.]
MSARFRASLAAASLAVAALTPAAAHADAIGIVAIGDSNFDPPGVRAENLYPPQLEAAATRRWVCARCRGSNSSSSE